MNPPAVRLAAADGHLRASTRNSLPMCGPNFLGAGAAETNIIAGTTITGDTPCRSTNVDYRLDTASARAFLGQYVTLP